jgi:hypothetical protein
MRWLIVVLAFLAMAAVPRRHILIVGDSEACRVGWFVNKVKLPTDDVSVECKESTQVKWWADGRFAEALNRHPDTDAVLIFLGTNNFHDQAPPDVAPIINVVENKGIACIWVGNVAVRGKTWPINGLLHGVVSPTRCSYFDTEAAGITLDDGIHPGQSASVKWLKAIWPLIPGT